MAQILYVAPHGSDRNPGTSDAPFATLGRALRVVRERKAQGLPEGGVTIALAGGVYELAESLSLDAAAGGEPGKPVVIAAAEGETVRLLGGKRVAAETFEPVTDPATVERLAEEARGHVLQVDLAALGVADLGTLRSRGMGRPVQPAHLELFFGDQRMKLARWPNAGAWERIADVPRDSAKPDPHGPDWLMGDLRQGFHYQGDRPERWKQNQDIWVHGYWGYDWSDTYERVGTIEKRQHLIRTVEPYGTYGFHPGQRFYYLNILEELDQEGEYYVDCENGMLYFWPPEPVEEREALISVLETPMLDLSEASHVVLRGLTLEAARGHAVRITGGEAVRLEGCTLRHLGNYGVWVQGGRGHTVAGSTIYSTGDGGVYLEGGDRATLTPAGHAVEDCTLHTLAQWSRCCHPAVMMRGVGNRVRHNHIHNHPHCVILFNGNDHLIEANEIHDVCWETGDVGAIYLGRDYTERGNVIRRNYLHDVYGPGQLGAFAIYLDDCASGVAVEENVIARAQIGVLLGGGRDNLVRGNTFIECGCGIQMDARGISPKEVWQSMVNQTMRQRYEAMRPNEEPFRSRYPELREVAKYFEEGARGRGVPPEGNRFEGNVCVRSPFVRYVGELGGATAEMVEAAENEVIGPRGV